MAEDAPMASESAAATPERASLERHGIDYDAFQAASEAWSRFVSQLGADGVDGEPTGPRAEYRSALEAAIHAYLLHACEGATTSGDASHLGPMADDWSDWVPTGALAAAPSLRPCQWPPCELRQATHRLAFFDRERYRTTRLLLCAEHGQRGFQACVDAGVDATLTPLDEDDRG